MRVMGYYRFDRYGMFDGPWCAEECTLHMLEVEYGVGPDYEIEEDRAMEPIFWDSESDCLVWCELCMVLINDYITGDCEECASMSKHVEIGDLPPSHITA